MLLIDEVDKTDVEVEGLLLEVLSDFQVTIPEMGTIAAVRRPLVVLTSNATRELSEAIKRRCLFLHIDYPDAEREREIVVSQVPEVEEQLAGQIVEVVGKLRGMELRKAPSIAETIDWARTLVALGTGTLDDAGDRPDPRRRAQARQRPRAGRPRAEAAVKRPMTLLDRHIEFVEALRSAGLPVSLAEGLDAVEAIDALGLGRARDPAGGVRRHAGQAPEPPARLRPGLRPLLPGAGRAMGTTPQTGSSETEPKSVEPAEDADARDYPARRRSPGARRLPGGADDRAGDGRPRRDGDAGARGGPAVRADPGSRAGRAAVVVVQRDEPGLARRAGREGAAGLLGDERLGRRPLDAAAGRGAGAGVRAAGRRRGTPPRGRGPRARSTWPGTPSGRRSSRSTSPRHARPTSS